ncbi:hypothetical protein CBG53_03985 [Porphyromonas gingivalis]|nr:hypothetical protein CS550_07265 [Porphyromonas gingivalis]ERJ65009.1 hypothetical protein HMPREF1554_01862 [Porphyromonas gingivalis F0569]OWR80263.1 hypothetical protein SJDPG11_03795 [Porphyromonas gingivalis SJD11]OWP32620.1 hypothetical protein CBG53_03985 [Porphyromonas gingivalis]PDP65943.1 hypothetical protein CLI78_06965 [Porphyromonas gingivalis]
MKIGGDTLYLPKDEGLKREHLGDFLRIRVEEFFNVLISFGVYMCYRDINIRLKGRHTYARH